ncbi:hypothetical protein [uncultured Kriegella sp.]|uniref:hypothetical protein n=1 Tax=uncultured Kriegella sp. TaxID=1798910 RepID=UPI0030DBD990|tara:strand:+ start:33884 stop:34039 length:156 start_codon:yes stop_codon:yes gene_type:complete
MKKVIIAVMALVFNTFLFSCTDDSIAESDTLYETQATEGDDGDVDDGRGDD